jgi:general secretion pathway protein E
VDCRMTGFLGRLGLYELMTVSEPMREAVAKSGAGEALRTQAMKDGMRPLRLAGALKVAAGLTTLDEVFAATPPLV